MESNGNQINEETNKINEKNKLSDKKEQKMKEIFINLFTTEPNSEGTTKLSTPLEDGETLTETPKKKEKFNEILDHLKEFNLKKKLKKFHIFNHAFKDNTNNKILYNLGKAILFTYGKNFPKIENKKNKKTYTSDTGWGCMVRCGQMILFRGIYHLLKSTFDTKEAIFYTFPLFSNYPIKKENLHKFFHNMLNKYNRLTNISETGEKIKEFFPPFSIRTLCDFSELLDRNAGEWFSDVVTVEAFKKITAYFELFSSPDFNASILSYQGAIEIQDILEKCFIEKNKEKGNNQYIHSKNKFYYFNKMGIIFVNVRTGLDKIPKEYYKGIKELFNFKQCLGIIGGKTRSAYYFIGYNDDEDSLLYLDPHITKEDDKNINMNDILEKHVKKEVYLLKMSKMSTAFTIGFYFRNYEEFLSLFAFWQMAKQSKIPILGVVKQPIVTEDKKEYIDADTDDF